MGGDTNGNPGNNEGEATEKDVNEWLQATVDVFADAYGWSKDTIFAMFPAEVEILLRRIRTRNEQRDDAELVRLIVAARAPHTEDHGQGVLNTILAKYKGLKDDDVTEESIKRELAIARSLLQR